MSPNLSELVLQLSSEFDTCLDAILQAAQANKDTNADKTHATDESTRPSVHQLKATVLTLENQLKSIRIKAMMDHGDANLEKSIDLLKRDIDVKTATIQKYADTLSSWKERIPMLEAQCKDALKTRDDEKDFA